MDISKLLDRFNSKKLRPITGMVIAEVMIFLFSIESLIEWFNISPKLFILLFVLSCIFVFVLIHYIKQTEGERSWLKAMSQPLVYRGTTLFLVFFGIIFLIYVTTLPPYKVIAITEYREQQFSESKLVMFTNQANLDELSEEVQTLIGPQYQVKVDDNVDKNSKNSRLIIVPGICDHEKAVETIMKLEERLDYFLLSDEEEQVPGLYDLYYKKFEVDAARKENLIKKFGKGSQYAKTQIQFTDKKNRKVNIGNATVQDKIDRWFTNIKYTLNF